MNTQRNYGGGDLWGRFRLLGINPWVEYIVVSRSVQQVYPRCGSVVGESVRVDFRFVSTSVHVLNLNSCVDGGRESYDVDVVALYAHWFNLLNMKQRI